MGRERRRKSHDKDKDRMMGRKEDDERKKERGMRNINGVREEIARKPLENRESGEKEIVRLRSQ
jgi:hypothetical protein